MTWKGLQPFYIWGADIWLGQRSSDFFFPAKSMSEGLMHIGIGSGLQSYCTIKSSSILCSLVSSWQSVFILDLQIWDIFFAGYVEKWIYVRFAGLSSWHSAFMLDLHFGDIFIAVFLRKYLNNMMSKLLFAFKASSGYFTDVSLSWLFILFSITWFGFSNKNN